MRVHPLLAAGVLALVLPGLAAAQSRTQNFDVDPGWASVGSGNNDNNFGHWNSNVAGGAVGEGGGRFTRTTAVRYYADTALGGDLTLDSNFTAGGRIDWSAFVFPDLGPGLNVGHFNTGGPAHVGLLLNTDTAGQIKWRAIVAFDDGTLVESVPQAITTSNVDRTWSYTWDPNAGVFGGGLLTVNLSGAGGGTHHVDVSAADRARPLHLDSFGLSSLPAASNNANFFADVFIDDVTYSTVPEPGTLALGAVAIAGAAWLKRRKAANQAASQWRG